MVKITTLNYNGIDYKCIQVNNLFHYFKKTKGKYKKMFSVEQLKLKL